jgi:HSP20 family protein
MSLQKTNSAMRSQVPSLLDNFFNASLFDRPAADFSNTSTTVPAVNIKETPESFEVEMAAPGMSKEDFLIELDGADLTIRSEKVQPVELKEGERYNRQEFSYQSFERTFHLHKQVIDTAKISARYENGVLRLSIPKKEEARQITRRIDIQ